ncbi:MAG TPA: PH domain-containing protein [Thermomicrobiales bacterium]|jgi:hypothetical protein|nr:PH domain-containing protein [Thermomicrobiales bacterium]
MQNGPYFDKREQFQKIEAAMLPGEQVLGVFDMKGGGTGFLGISSQRVIVYDKAFARKNRSMISIPFGRITSIATEDESGLLTGRGFFGSSKVEMRAGHEAFEFEFRGADKAHQAHDLILRGMFR